MILKTERLILSPWQPEDWIAFRPIAQDPEVMRYITGGKPWTDDEIRNFIDRQVALFAGRGFCRWKVTGQTGDEVMGFCGVGFWRGAIGEPEIGWWLARRFWGLGYASEGARAAMEDVFRRTELPRLISVAMPGNRASIHIMEKLGMHFEAEFEGENTRLVRYALTRDEYLSRAQALEAR